MAYASVTSDLWVGLDEMRNFIEDEDDSSLWLGLALIFFSTLQCIGTLSRLVVPTRKRSIMFFQTILILTTASEAPIVVLVYLNSQSSLKWISILLSSGSITFQVFNLMIAVCRKRKEDKDAKHRPELKDIPAPQLSLQQAAAAAEPIAEEEPEAMPEPLSADEILDVTQPLASTAQVSGPSHNSPVCWAQSLSPFSSPLYTARSPRKTPRVVNLPKMTTPREVSTVRSLLSTPKLFSTRQHSPMNTPRGFTPRLEESSDRGYVPENSQGDLPHDFRLAGVAE